MNRLNLQLKTDNWKHILLKRIAQDKESFWDGVED